MFAATVDKLLKTLRFRRSFVVIILSNSRQNPSQPVFIFPEGIEGRQA